MKQSVLRIQGLWGQCFGLGSLPWANCLLQLAPLGDLWECVFPLSPLCPRRLLQNTSTSMIYGYGLEISLVNTLLQTETIIWEHHSCFICEMYQMHQMTHNMHTTLAGISGRRQQRGIGELTFSCIHVWHVQHEWSMQNWYPKCLDLTHC